jgi:hypothetical protein
MRPVGVLSPICANKSRNSRRVVVVVVRLVLGCSCAVINPGVELPWMVAVELFVQFAAEGVECPQRPVRKSARFACLAVGVRDGHGGGRKNRSRLLELSPGGAVLLDGHSFRSWVGGGVAGGFGVHGLGFWWFGLAANGGLVARTY